jgi:hypothetical protein
MTRPKAVNAGVLIVKPATLLTTWSASTQNAVGTTTAISSPTALNEMGERRERAARSEAATSVYDCAILIAGLRPSS